MCVWNYINILLTQTSSSSSHSYQFSSLLFPVFRSSFSCLFFSHPSLTALLNFTHFLSLPLTCPCLSLISNLLSSPAEAENHHHLRGGEEISTQVHHRSKGQHAAGDPGGHRGFCGDAPAGFQLGDHHPEGGARQTGPSAHTGVCKGERCKWDSLFWCLYFSSIFLITLTSLIESQYIKLLCAQ